MLWARVDSPLFCPPFNRFVSDQLFVSISHVTPANDTLTSVYVHLDTAYVDRGDVVTQGQVIGLSGNSGCSTEPHLHFHVWRITETNDGTPTRIDPYGWYALGTRDPWARHPEGAASINLWSEPPPLCTSTKCYSSRYADREGGG